MSRSQREKGKRGERDCARVYVAEGIDVRRLGNAARLSDLSGLEEYRIHPEVKSQGRLDIAAWMRQAEAEAPDGFDPVLHWRLCRRGASTPWYATTPLTAYIDLLKRASA